MEKKSPRFTFIPSADKIPLLIHNRFPQKQFSVHWADTDRQFYLQEIRGTGDPCDDKKISDLYRSAEHWLFAQIKMGAIVPPVWQKVILTDGSPIFIKPEPGISYSTDNYNKDGYSVSLNMP